MYAKICTVAALALSVGLANSGACAASLASPLQSVEAAVDQLDGWLSHGPNGQQWRRYLKLDQLRAQLAMGPAADRTAVESVLNRFRSGAPGLDHPRFARVRQALQSWLADLSPPSQADLADAAKAAQSSFAVVPNEEVAKSRQRLDEALKNLGRDLAKSGAVAAGWRTYLRLNDLQAELAKKEGPDFKVLRSIRRRFIQDKPGLERPALVRAGDALRDYTDTAEAAATADLSNQYPKRLQALVERITAYDRKPTEESARVIGEHLDWLLRNRQADRLVSTVRRRYSFPNLFVQTAPNIVAAGIERPVDDTTPIRDVILGTNIVGSGHTIGRIDAKLVPDARQGVFDTILTGTTSTRTVGYNGPATICADGVTRLRCSQRIVIDPVGMGAFPAMASARTSTTIRGISAGRGRGIIQRIATRRVYESKGQAEYIGSQHAEDRVEKRLEAEVNPGIKRANGNYQDQLRGPLVRMRAFPELLQFSTTKDWLYTTVLMADRSQLSAPGSPPQLTGDHDFSIRIHESLPNNAGLAMYSGRKVTEKEAQTRAKKLFGKVPDELKSDNGPPWSMTLAERPLTVIFGEGTVVIVIHGEEFAREKDLAEDTTANVPVGPLDIGATYKIEGPKLVRQGPLDIHEPGSASRTVPLRKAGPLGRIRKRFDQILKPEYTVDDLELPGEWKRAGKLKSTRLQSSGGWLVLQWIQPDAASAPARTPVAIAEPR